MLLCATAVTLASSFPPCEWEEPREEVQHPVVVSSAPLLYSQCHTNVDMVTFCFPLRARARALLYSTAQPSRHCCAAWSR